MENYKVKWGIGFDAEDVYGDLDEMEHPEVRIKAASPEEAYAKFLESEQKILDTPVVIAWGLTGLVYFEEHIGRTKKAAETENWKHEKTNRASLVETENSKQEKTYREPLVEQKLDKLYSVLNHIRWMIFGFMFIVIFIPGLYGLFVLFS